MIITVTDERGRAHRVQESAMKECCKECANRNREKGCTHGIARHIGRPWIGSGCEFKQEVQ